MQRISHHALLNNYCCSLIKILSFTIVKLRKLHEALYKLNILEKIIKTMYFSAFLLLINPFINYLDFNLIKNEQTGRLFVGKIFTCQNHKNESWKSNLCVSFGFQLFRKECMSEKRREDTSILWSSWRHFGSWWSFYSRYTCISQVSLALCKDIILLLYYTMYIAYCMTST